MTMALPYLDRADGADALYEALDASGAAVLRDALDVSGLARVDAALAPWFAAAPCGEGVFFGRRTRRFSALFHKAPVTAALAIDPLLLETAERVLGAGTRRCDCIQLNLTQAIGIGPGEPAQTPHRDDDFFPFPHDHDLMLNVMWALDPFTVANGATCVAPGSHRWDRKRRAEPSELAVAEAPAGAAVIWRGAALHGGGANTTETVRRGVVMSYSVGWLAPAEKLLLSIPPDTARGLPERLQRLIGYQIHRPNLGWVEGRDPIEWLHGSTGALASAGDNLTPRQEAALAALTPARRQEEARP
jgi:ectoine hydroxylase-related dioxygenase (phytanoyl-CoA dioxygenase family)